MCESVLVADVLYFFFSSRRRHTICLSDWSSDVCSSDLIGLAPHWQRDLPTAAFAAPNAPEPVAGGPGYQWFPISRLDPGEMQRGVEAAAGALDTFLDAELARLELPPERLALVGF